MMGLIFYCAKSLGADSFIKWFSMVILILFSFAAIIISVPIRISAQNYDFAILNVVSSFMPVWLFVVIIIVIAEILFFVDKEKPRKNINKFLFTLWKKIICLADSFVSIVGAIGVGVYGMEIYKSIYSEHILLFAEIIGIIIIFVVYIYLNSIKYRLKK